MFMYVRLITESEDTRLFVSYTQWRQWRSTRVTLEYPRVSASLSSFLLLTISLSFFLLAATHDIPDTTSKLYTRGWKASPTPDSDSRNFASSRPFDRRTSFLLLFSSGTLESLFRVFTYYRTHFHPSIVVYSLRISFRHIGRKRIFPIFQSK